MRTIVIRISLIVAIIAGAAVIQFHLVHLKGKMTALNNALAARTAALERSEADLASAREEAKKTALVLKKTAGALDAKVAQAATQAEQIAKLNQDAKTLRQERDDAQDEVSAYRVSIPTPEQVANVAKEIKTLRDSLAASDEEKTLLMRRIKRLEALVPMTGDVITLPADLNAKVLVIDPKWGFVVLDAGEEQGMLEHGELLINRGGRLVAKVLVTRVEKDRSVANIVPGWELTQLIEGDRAIPARPRL